MPTYIYGCTKCKEAEEVWHLMKDCETFVLICSSCGKRMVRQPQVACISIEARGWEAMNQGRGQYISQLEQKADGKKSDFAHCRSMNELKDKAARVGMDVHQP